MGYLVLFKRQWRREWCLQRRNIRSLLNACLFFLMVMMFFPLTLPADPVILRQMVPALVWIASLLALLMSAERLFQQEHDDGVLEQWLVSGYPLGFLLAAKLILHWGLHLLPIILLCPLLALFFSLTTHELLILSASLVLGTPSIFLLCALASAFATQLQQKGLLMALVLFPLTIPILIFGAGTLTAALQHFPVAAYLALLGAMSLLAIAFLPLAIAAILRIALSS
jgi:heme exporter protein B